MTRANTDQLKTTPWFAKAGDRQIVKSPVAWHSDHVQVGQRHVQMFSLKTTPEASRPCLFSGLLSLDCDSVLCTTWRVKSTSAARSEIDAQEKFISFFKVGVFTRVMSGRDTASLETGAGAKAANNNVDDLSEVIRSLDKKAQGEFSLRLLLAAHNPQQLRDVVPAVHRIFVDARAQVMEESRRDAPYDRRAAFGYLRGQSQRPTADFQPLPGPGGRQAEGIGAREAAPGRAQQR
jgi:hypothetical protein